MRGALAESRQNTKIGLAVSASFIRGPAGSTSRRTTICLPWKKTGAATNASGVVACLATPWADSAALNVLKVPIVLVVLELTVLRVLIVPSITSTVSTLSTSTLGTLCTVSTLRTYGANLARGSVRGGGVCAMSGDITPGCVRCAAWHSSHGCRPRTARTPPYTLCL